MYCVYCSGGNVNIDTYRIGTYRLVYNMGVNGLRNVRGMQDLYGQKMELFHFVKNTAWSLAKCYGYSMLDTPILEYSDIFTKTLGETSDIVNKETYTFQDKDGRCITMRPEFTASVARAIITNGLTQTLPQKLFSCGPLFRHERPQKGRYRQFHQINCEFIGAMGPSADVETILLIQALVTELGLSKHITLEVNTLGDGESRARYKAALTCYFRDHYSSLSDDSRAKIETNPLRILDTKIDDDKKIVAHAPKITSYLNDISKNHYDYVISALHTYQIEHKINDKIVRGLDYYTHTVFEFTTNLLGSQSAVIGGGRYDKLIALMGGVDDIPSIGFGLGIERIIELLLCLDLKKGITKIEPIFAIITVGYTETCTALALATKLRNQHNLIVFLDHNPQSSVKKQLQKASRNNVDYAIFIGPEEVQSGIVKIRSMLSGDEISVPNTDLDVYLHSLVQAYKK